MGGLSETGRARPTPCWPVRRDWWRGPPFQQDASRQNQCAEKCSFSASEGGKSLPSSTKLVLERSAGASGRLALQDCKTKALPHARRPCGPLFS